MPFSIFFHHFALIFCFTALLVVIRGGGFSLSALLAFVLRWGNGPRDGGRFTWLKSDIFLVFVSSFGAHFAHFPLFLPVTGEGAQVFVSFTLGCVGRGIVFTV